MQCGGGNALTVVSGEHDAAIVVVACEDARVEHVTVYGRGARVRRVTAVSALPPTLRITGLPLAVIDDTVRIEIVGPALATSVRAGLEVMKRDVVPEDIAELHGAKRRIEVARSELERIES